MKRKNVIQFLILAILAVFSAAVYANCIDEEKVVGAVYTMTNAASNNEVVIFNRDDDGILTKEGTIPTGGNGSGGGLDQLGSQGSIVLSQNSRWLLVVNAGSNEISVFRVLFNGLKLVDKVSSGGEFPISLTIFENIVYVLNAKGSSNITGFSLSKKGELMPIKYSTRLLGVGGFAQVGFDEDGDNLVVTDKANNRIFVFSIGHNKLPGWFPVISNSNGLTPFGFIFDKRDHLLVVEAGTDAVSSYTIPDRGTLRVISPSVANGQKAACWITGNNRKFVFTANPGTHSISAYQLNSSQGSLVLLNGTAGVGNTPIDLSITEGRFLYALDPSSGGIDMFKIEQDGSLSNLGTVSGGFSVFAQGIAAR